ncbi:MAG: hypothetical protein HUU01_02640 [Saprospiraceae bacterium]|nr:hypothetical protein [Saprospiraceae bacterium]
MTCQLLFAGLLFAFSPGHVYRSSDWGSIWELAYESPDKNLFFTLTAADTVIYFCKNIGC